MKIIRYSVAAFEPQEQTHHAKHIQYHLSGKFNLEDYPEFMRWQIQRIHEQKETFYKEHLDISDPTVLWGGCYIPEREMWKIRNVRRRRKTA